LRFINFGSYEQDLIINNNNNKIEFSEKRKLVQTGRTSKSVKIKRKLILAAQIEIYACGVNKKSSLFLEGKH